jgi:hypothetical protein
MKSKESVLRGVVMIMLIIGGYAFIAALFVPKVRDALGNPIVSGLFGTMVGFWFKEVAQGTAYLFGGTKAANEANSKIADFAIAPGSVTADGGQPVVNNSVTNSADPAADSSSLTPEQRSANT